MFAVAVLFSAATATAQVWTAAVTGACTLLAGVGAAWITHLAGARRAWDERANQRRVEQREAVVEVLRTGWEYKSALDGFVMIAAVITDRVQLAERPATDQYIESRRVFHRALISARILVRDPHQVADGLWQLTDIFDRVMPWFTEVTDKRTGKYKSQEGRLVAASAPARQVEQLLTELEGAAAVAYVTDDGRPTQRRWWSRER